MNIGKLILVTTLTGLALIAGCKPATKTGTENTVAGLPTTSAKPGAKEADVAPRLIVRDGFKVWDNPALFGPVPAELISAGREVCATMNTQDTKFVPTGYHSQAIDEQGIAFQGGGYYCEPKP
jgi:hypothetical protein